MICIKLGEKLADSCENLQCYGLSVCKRLDKYSNVNTPALSIEVKRSKCFLRGHQKTSVSKGLCSGIKCYFLKT